VLCGPRRSFQNCSAGVTPNTRQRATLARSLRGLHTQVLFVACRGASTLVEQLSTEQARDPTGEKSPVGPTMGRDGFRGIMAESAVCVGSDSWPRHVRWSRGRFEDRCLPCVRLACDPDEPGSGLGVAKVPIGMCMGEASEVPIHV